MDRKPEMNFGIFGNPSYIYATILVLLILFFLTGVWLFGIFIGAAIVWLVVLEFWQGMRKHGIKNELRETIVALIVALTIWFGAGYVLQTPSPINAIVSCSMLPHISRGDLVILRGDRINAPIVEVESIDGIGSAEAYQNGIFVRYFNGSIYSYCAQAMKDEICEKFVKNPQEFTEKHGQITVGYEKCKIYYMKSGLTQTGPCATYLEINGKRYYENADNDIVVYQPDESEYYSKIGDIIHRVFVRLKTNDGKEYFLTKGDNNPIFDFQIYDEESQKGNYAIENGRYKGRILAAIPYVGYLKLFISPAAIPTPEGCDRVYSKWLNSQNQTNQMPSA